MQTSYSYETYPTGMAGYVSPTRGKVSKDTEEAGLCRHALTHCTRCGGAVGGGRPDDLRHSRGRRSSGGWGDAAQLSRHDGAAAAHGRVSRYQVWQTARVAQRTRTTQQGLREAHVRGRATYLRPTED